MKVFFVGVALLSTFCFGGHETGGGNPEAVRFRLLALHSLKAARECKVPEALLRPFSFIELERVIRTTPIRLTEEQLVEGGGIVYAKPEKDEKTGELRIAVFEPEWKKYPKKNQQIGVEWAVWNLHEYLRVLGLGKGDDVYEISTEFVERARTCLPQTDALRFSAIEFSYEIRSPLITVVSKRRDIDPSEKYSTNALLCKAEFPEIPARTGREINRSYLEWNRTEKPHLIVRIRDELKDLDLLDIETQPSYSDHVGYFAPSFLKNERWVTAQCAGGIQERQMRIKAYVADPINTFQSSKEEFYASEVNVKAWSGATEASHWAKEQVDAHANAEIKSQKACDEWLIETKRVYGTNYRFAKCSLQDSHFKPWLEDSGRAIGETIRFSRSGTVYWVAN